MPASPAWGAAVDEPPQPPPAREVAVVQHLLTDGLLAVDSAALADAAPRTVTAGSAEALPGGLQAFRCGDTGDHVARPATALAWDALCAEAEDAGVDPGLQRAQSLRDEDLLLVPSSEDDAPDEPPRGWVRRLLRDLACATPACNGTEIVLAEGSGLYEFVTEAIGCAGHLASVDMARTSCEEHETVVRRYHRYGFTSVPGRPLALRFVLPTGDRPDDCRPAPWLPVPQMVAALFRCRLAQAGLPEPLVRQVAAEAVVVSWCESRWDPGAVVFDGRYRDGAHPRTGMRYSAAGVFQFIRDSANRWIRGGYENVHDPVANVDGAARYLLAVHAQGGATWGPWACAAVNDGFKRGGSVLPGWPGGPAELPDWAWRW